MNNAEFSLEYFNVPCDEMTVKRIFYFTTHLNDRKCKQEVYS
jgi:hypothetical protein